MRNIRIPIAVLFTAGSIEDGGASVDIEIGGYFNLDGTPNRAGPLECDSFGEVNTAPRVG